MPTPGTVLRRFSKPLRLVTAAGFVVSLAVHHSPVVHAVAGLAFAVAATGHTLANGRWMRTVARRVPRGVPRRIAIDAGVALAMICLAGIVVVSGVIMLATGAAAAGEGARGSHATAAELHGHCALLLVIVVATHVLRHRRQLRVRHRHAPRRPAPGEPAEQRSITRVGP